MENKNELKASHRFGRFPTISMSEWSNGSFSISKSLLKDKSNTMGWKDKDNVERITLLQFYYNELFQVSEVLNNKKTIGNFEFVILKAENGTIAGINIIKTYTKDGQKESKKYEINVNEFHIIKTLVNRVIEADYEKYTPQKHSRDNTDNANFGDMSDGLIDEPIDDDIPF